MKQCDFTKLQQFTASNIVLFCLD